MGLILLYMGLPVIILIAVLVIILSYVKRVDR